MNLYKLRIQGFRKHFDTTVTFSDSTFLIGENNVGKSSILHALDYLLNNKNKIPCDEYFSCTTSDGFKKQLVDNIVLTAEFNNLPTDAKTWRGFKGRVQLSQTPSEGQTGLSYLYRKTFPNGSTAIFETLENKKILKPCFENCITIQEFLDNGLVEETLPDELKNNDRTKKLTQADQKLLFMVEDIFDIDEDKSEWIKNPGGIPQNVISKLPKYLLIPAQDKEDEITGSSGTLQNTLSELFDEIKESSENYKKAQEYLEKLSKELDPADNSTEISKMILELNDIVSEIFPNTGISATANLNDANKVIKPIFNVEMNSNVSTSAKLQGTGLIRSTVFALLRYKSLRDNRKGDSSHRPLIIGFEEPEIYLHPNAINKMRDTIYSLAESGNNQIVCTTHSPYMIDISKKPSQVLNSIWITNKTDIYDNENVEIVGSTPFNVTEEYQKLQGDAKDYIKMILKIDETVAKSFFVKKVLIVEGDTEQVVLTETINKMPAELKTTILSDWHIIKARGKAAIIPLIKYLKAMAIDIYVMHDSDLGVSGAEVFNEPIQHALNDNNKLIKLNNCIEDVLGYPPPNADKPFKAYKFTIENWNCWNDIPEIWRRSVEKLFIGGAIIVQKEFQEGQ